MNRIARVGILAGLAAIGIATAATGTASADRTGIIYGEKACQDTAHAYQQAGYIAYCFQLQGNSWQVDYHKPGESAFPGDAPLLSVQGFAQRLAGILASGSASASQ